MLAAVLPAILLSSLLPACHQDGAPKPDDGAPVDSVGVTGEDQDQDGYAEEDGDCNDADAGIHPGAGELCDGLDNDCDGTIDEELEQIWQQDADGDGFGDPAVSTSACEAPQGYVASGTDCDDTNGSVYPGAEELCTDLIDRDCDGEIGAEDLDGDGAAACEDCDDTDPDAYPGAQEVCDAGDVDEDCDGLADDADPSADATGMTLRYADADGDGYGDSAAWAATCDGGGVLIAGDCDDADPAYNPAAAETCDDPRDLNCDGSVGYADADGDGFPACQECDDGAASVNPAGTEICNGVDDNCDGQVDEGGAGASTFYADADGDGWGDPGAPLAACAQPAGYVTDASDCADADAAVNPGAVEVCDGLDNDCDGSVDAGAADARIWYADADGDGYGEDGSAQSGCVPDAGSAAVAGDCDDADPAYNPGAAEPDCADPRDYNCDGSVAYADSDGDGAADCVDCDPADAASFPGGIEVCDGADNDCDGAVDVGASDAGSWYADADGDGYGDAGAVLAACAQPAGYVADASDCADGDAAVSPAAAEVCDGIDNDCSGASDDNAVDATLWHADADCDGYGDAAGVSACAAPAASYLTDGSDCDDGDGRDAPGAPERCDGVDNDCDGAVDESCVTPIQVAAPSAAAVSSPAQPAACARLAETTALADIHYVRNLPTFMAALDGGAGYMSHTDTDSAWMDWSIRCGSDRSASPGNYSPTNAWPALTPSGSYGAGRFRGYINIGCGEELNRTIGLIGNDSLSLSIEGATILQQNWDDGRWKKFRYVSFPGPGMYAFEIQWSTNFICDIDPMELVWAEGFVSGYDNYDTMCYYGACAYGNGQAIPGFTVIDGWNLAQASDGGDTSCQQCSTSADCGGGICNSAGICE